MNRVWHVESGCGFQQKSSWRRLGYGGAYGCKHGLRSGFRVSLVCKKICSCYTFGPGPAGRPPGGRALVYRVCTVYRVYHLAGQPRPCLPCLHRLRGGQFSGVAVTVSTGDATTPGEPHFRLSTRSTCLRPPGFFYKNARDPLPHPPDSHTH